MNPDLRATHAPARQGSAARLLLAVFASLGLGLAGIACGGDVGVAAGD